MVSLRGRKGEQFLLPVVGGNGGLKPQTLHGCVGFFFWGGKKWTFLEMPL